MEETSAVMCGLPEGRDPSPLNVLEAEGSDWLCVNVFWPCWAAVPHTSLIECWLIAFLTAL